MAERCDSKKENIKGENGNKKVRGKLVSDSWNVWGFPFGNWEEKWLFFKFSKICRLI
jgi:hypothetical protein